MFRDQLSKIEDIAVIAIVLQVAIIINVLSINFLFSLNWWLGSLVRYLVVINLLLITFYGSAKILGMYFDFKLEASNITKEELEIRKKEKEEKREEEREEKKRLKDEARKEKEIKQQREAEENKKEEDSGVDVDELS